MSEQLKLCPFCNGKASIAWNANSYYVMCGSCRLTTEILDTHEEAAKAWNTRAATGYDEKVERRDFEKWSESHYVLKELSIDFEDGEYIEPEMQYAYESWRACAMSKAGVGE